MADQAYAGGFPVPGPAAAHLRVGPEVQQAAHHQADREHGAPRQGETSRIIRTLSQWRVYTFLPLFCPYNFFMVDSPSIYSVAKPYSVIGISDFVCNLEFLILDCSIAHMF